MDINTALARATAMACAGGKGVSPAKLIPQYGKVAQRLTARQIKEKTDGWLASARKK